MAKNAKSLTRQSGSSCAANCTKKREFFRTFYNTKHSDQCSRLLAQASYRLGNSDHTSNTPFGCFAKTRRPWATFFLYLRHAPAAISTPSKCYDLNKSMTINFSLPVWSEVKMADPHCFRQASWDSLFAKPSRWARIATSLQGRLHPLHNKALCCVRSQPPCVC